MPAPEINSTSSVLGCRQFENFTFQPSATNTPTVWIASALPPGVAINAGTGAISGASTASGVWVVSLRAGNASGTSAARIFTIGIGVGSSSSSSSAIEIEIDLVTRKVSAGVAAAAASGVEAPVVFLKFGDTALFSVTFKRGGAVVEVPITALKWTLKELETEAQLVTSTAFDQVGSGANTRYRVLAQMAGDALKNALGNYEDDAGTEFSGLCEFEWSETIDSLGGTTSARFTSRTFRAEAARDLIAN